MRLGIICYDYPHLKTEQVMTRLLLEPQIEQIRLFALPFTPRPARATVIQHRPDQTRAISPDQFAAHQNVTFQRWDGASPLDGCDLYLITGAGIINADLTNGRPILNAHPGIIPSVRGLDAFKWAIHDSQPLGNTLHYIDNEVDAGEVLAIRPTPVYAGDTLETLARRHYENEIDMISNFPRYLKEPNVVQYPEREPHKRMSAETEAEMVRRFDEYKERFALGCKRPAPAKDAAVTQ